MQRKRRCSFQSNCISCSSSRVMTFKRNATSNISSVKRMQLSLPSAWQVGWFVLVWTVPCFLFHKNIFTYITWNVAAELPWLNLISPSRTNPATFSHLSVYISFNRSTSDSILSASAFQQGHLGNYTPFFLSPLLGEKKMYLMQQVLELIFETHHLLTFPAPSTNPEQPVLSCDCSSQTKVKEYQKFQLKAKQLPKKS